MATKEWTLKGGEELRLEVGFGQTVEVRLVAGCAEYFGAELGRDATYTLSGENGAVFSWDGCTLAVTGECASAYVAGETPMASYINLHMAAQQRRLAAHGVLDAGGEAAGPRILIVGPEDSGKTSLARLLLNYAVRQGETPVFVDLDPADAKVTVPGTVAAMPVTKTIDVGRGFMGYSVPASSGLPDAPLVWQFGHEDPAANPQLFNLLVDGAAAAVGRRMAADRWAAGSGMVVDTRGASDVGQDKVLLHAVTALGIDTVVVVGNERMFSVLEARMAGTPVAVVKMARSGGAVDRTALYKQQLNSKAVRQYFYGTDRDQVASFSTVVNFDDIRILRVGEDVVAPSSTLPLGEERKVTDTLVSAVEPDESLIHSLLAVTDGPRRSDGDDMAVDTADPDGVIGIQVLGFVSVSNVEMDRRRLIIVSPVPGRLQKQMLLYGNTKWVETA
ncbi:Cleavage polyadenylation factor subunit clp1 [Coemansia spiralis]|nr:Cleavage polyadenylation factor subunit clp1 [Coemansia spiralis]